MREDTTIPFRNPALRDELSELVREGAQRIIRQAVEAELEPFWKGMRPTVTRKVDARWFATATCRRGRC